MNERQLFSIEELVRRWGVSRHTLLRRINSGELTTINIGSRILVPMREVERVEEHGLGQTKRNRTREAAALA